MAQRKRETRALRLASIGDADDTWVPRRASTERAPRAPAITAAVATLRAKRTVTVSHRTLTPTAQGAPAAVRAHVLDVPFAMRVVAMACGARWDATHRAFL
jgi:hypothetical protein